MTLAVSRAFMVGFDKQSIDTDLSQASGFASYFQKSMNVHCGTGVGTAVTLYQSICILHVLHWLITSYYKIKCMRKIHLQRDKSSNDVEN